jgi:diacylglycerol kinase (ATP)
MSALLRPDSICQGSLALVSPAAANVSLHEELLGAFERCGGAVVVASNKCELIEAIKAANAQHRSRLIVVGGDGSLSCVVNALQATAADYEIGIVPAGTGNDFARSLRLPVDDPALAWEVALNGAVRAVDLVELKGNQPGFFVNAVTAGFGGRQAGEIAAEQKPALGKLAYWLAAITQLGDMPEFDLRVSANGQALSIRCFGFWVANGRYTGGGFPVAPEALLDDGMLDVVVVPSMPALELLAAGVDLTLVGAEQSDRLLTFRTANLTVAAAQQIPLSIDGDPADCQSLECHVLRHALRIIAGNNDPAEGSGVAASEK